jgi:uncharacterized radical SAM superfamily Fe-S cluster-containing enzyme
LCLYVPSCSNIRESLRVCFEFVCFVCFFQAEHNRRQFEKSFNAIFVFLIPKKADVVNVKDFKPISLVGGVLISKVLANRFKSVFAKIISSSQNAFIGGR